MNLSKPLVISILLNLIFTIGVLAIAVNYRHIIFSQMVKRMFHQLTQASSYHLDTTVSPLNLSVAADYTNNTQAFNQVTFHWDYSSSSHSAQFIYNHNEEFFSIRSELLKAMLLASLHLSQEFKAETLVSHPVFLGNQYLHLDRQVVENMIPREAFEKQTLELSQLYSKQLIESLQLRSVPSLQIINRIPVLKLPLSLNFHSPSEQFDRLFKGTTFDVYVNFKNQPVKVVITTPFVPKDIDATFPESNPFLSWLKTLDQPVIIDLTYSEFNQIKTIDKPSESVEFSEFMQSLQPPTTPQPSQKPLSKYRINNAILVKPSGSDVDKHFYMIHNMLFRYYQDHKQYPSTLDPLAKNYFPDAVPGNPRTASGFFYQTFDANQGYLLCPEPTSPREYCFKKYKLDSIY